MDSKEETIRINEIRTLFIKQCRNGIWKEHNNHRYVNDYFRIEYDDNYKKWRIQIDDSNILSSWIGISSFLFYFLRILVRFNAKNYEKKKIDKERQLLQIDSFQNIKIFNEIVN